MDGYSVDHMVGEEGAQQQRELVQDNRHEGEDPGVRGDVGQVPYNKHGEEHIDSQSLMIFRR